MTYSLDADWDCYVSGADILERTVTCVSLLYTLLYALCDHSLFVVEHKTLTAAS